MQAKELQDIARQAPHPGHLALKNRPFRLTSDPAFYFDSRTHSEALRGLQSFLHRGEGLALVYGEAGTGKTLLCRRFLEGLDRKEYNVGLIISHMINEKEFIVEALRAFDITPCCPSTKANTFETLRSLIKMEGEKEKQSVLAVDEAQLLSDDLLELLARHSDSRAKGGKSLCVVLFAQEDLVARLVDHRMRHLRQRITTTHCLQPLSPDEIGPYIIHRLAKADPHGLIRFDEDAIRSIYGASRGYAKVVNTISDHCLLLLDGRSRTAVNRRIVNRVLKKEGTRAFPGEKTIARGRPGIVYFALLGVILAFILYQSLLLLRLALGF